jgi:hypothetical protein
MRSKHRSGPRNLPGWGSVPNPEDWKAIDELNEQEAAAAAAGG